MPLEANRIQLVAPAEIRMCEMCGAFPIPDRMPYVAFNNKSGDDFAPGLIHTVDEQPASTAYRVRDQSGDTVARIVHNPQICCDCIKRAAELAGYGDRQPLLAEIDELKGRLATLEEQYELSESQRTEAELALRETSVYERLLAAGLPVAKAATATAKRPARKA